jgi:orotate phosphoribosyltransferase
MAALWPAGQRGYGQGDLSHEKAPAMIRPMNDYDPEELKRLLAEHALKFGTFTLASGKTASYYLDCRHLTLHPRGINVIAAGILQRLEAMASLPDAVGGMAIGADPITAGVVTIAGQRGLPLFGFMVRKEPKGHGTGRQVEGPVKPGQDVVIVEDVITSGGSALAAVKAAREFGLNVRGVIGIIDRLAGGQAAFEAEGVQLQTLLTVRDFGIEP